MKEEDRDRDRERLEKEEKRQDRGSKQPMKVYK